MTSLPTGGVSQSVFIGRTSYPLPHPLTHRRHRVQHTEDGFRNFLRLRNWRTDLLPAGADSRGHCRVFFETLPQGAVSGGNKHGGSISSAASIRTRPHHYAKKEVAEEI